MQDPLFSPRIPLIEVFRPTPRPDLSRFRALVRRVKCEARYARAMLSRLVFRLLNKTHIVWCALRSCAGHICTQPSTDNCLRVGPALRNLPGRGWVANPRTEFCKSHIENLKGLHPWLDRVDLRLFLAGFETGEEFAAHSGNERNTPTSQSPSD